MTRARQLLRETKLPSNLTSKLPKHLRKRQADFSPEALADSLAYVIEIERGDGKVKVGGSKVGGDPHVPSDFEWPTVDGKPTLLLVQLDLEEVAAADVSKRVPPKGTLYVFVNELGHGCVRHTESRELVIRTPPVVPQYLAELARERRLSFRPGFYFLQGTDTGTPGAVAEALPEKLRSDVARVLGCSADPCHAFADDRIFGGDPVDWAGMGESYLEHELFIQLRFADGNVAVGVDGDDLVRGDFSDADCRYCGTEPPVSWLEDGPSYRAARRRPRSAREGPAPSAPPEGLVTSGRRSRVLLPNVYDNGSFARFVPFGDGREVIVRRGREIGSCVYGLEQSRRTVALGGLEVPVVRYQDILSPPVLPPGAAPIVDEGQYRPISDVIHLPDAEILVRRSPKGFSDTEMERILAAIVIDEPRSE